jgi:endonuclease/exonuclease/phosphatase family metal-dependent hydrolase
LAVLAIGIALISVYINPQNFWIPAIFGMTYPYLLIINLIFVIIWIFVKPKFLIFSLLIIIAGYQLFVNIIQFSGEKTEKKGIRITSYNVRYFMGNHQYPNKENADHIIDFLRQDNADIICLQEVKLNKRQIFDLKNTRLPQVNHMQLAHTSYEGGSLTLTRYPIVNMGEIRFKSSGNMIIYTDLEIDYDTVRVFNCHLQSYRLGEKEINDLDSIDFEDHIEAKQKLKVLIVKYKNAIMKRAEQAATLKASISISPYPVIVCGDFNDPPGSFTYHTVSGGLKDSFVESGKGTANTYNGKLPSFRIDYILYSPVFKSYNFKVTNIDHSDHFPVSCDLFEADK